MSTAFLELDEDDGFDPFAPLDAIVDSPKEARFWLDLLRGIRSAMFIPLVGWSTEEQLRESVHSKREDELEFILLIREVALDPERSARAVCSIDLWTARAEIEWGLP